MLPAPTEVETFAKQALELPTLAMHRARFEKLLADYGRSYAQQDKSVTVALVGSTGAGKSTLLNALAGQRLADEGEVRPTSRRATIYAPVDAVVPRLQVADADVQRYTPHPSAPWSGQVLIDTPDVNSVDGAHREIAREVLELADVAVVVMHRGSVAEQSQADFLRDFARRRALLFVINYADQLGAASADELRRQVFRVAAEQFGVVREEIKVFVISALQARRAEPDSGEFAALLGELQALGEKSASERVKRSNAFAALNELVKTSERAKAELDAALAQVDGELAKGFDAALPDLTADFEQRLLSARDAIADELKRKASSRWWGPAALWMRLSLAGGTGLGAAALLVRRSLPIGLAVAAASTVVDQLGQRTRAHAAQKRVIGPGAEVSERSARAILSSARAAAIAAGLSPESLALPQVELLIDRLTTARVAAWEHVSSVAIAEAVDRWWRWARFLLVPLVNLPLFALFGHVAYQVVRGYLEGRYLDLGYFMHSGALALLLCIAGATVGSLSLAGVRRGILGRGSAHFRAALGSLRTATLDELRGAYVGPRSAVDRLGRLRAT